MGRKAIVTKEKWNDVNKDNKTLYNNYIFNCKADGKSKKTIETYQTSIKLFLVWVLDNKDNSSVLTLLKRDYQEYGMYIRERNLSTATHNNYISSVKNMMEYAEDSDEIKYDKNTCSKVKGLKIQRVMKKTYLTDEQVTKLFNELVRIKEYQMATYLSISYDSTARVSEIMQIEKHGFLESNRNNTNFVHKKGYSEPSPIVYFKRTKDIVILYLSERGEDTIDSLWLSIFKKPCTVDAAEYWCEKMSKILSIIEGCKIRFTPHDLRRTAIENYYNGTHYMCEVRIQRIPYSIHDIQLLANHKEQATTEIYLKNNKQKNLENAFGIKIVS